MSDQEIEALERRLQINLPDDYKHFLRTTNGGIPKPDCFVVPERGPVMTGILYGIRRERTSCDLEYEQEQAAMWDPLPPGYVAIGDDPGGSTLLLATLGADAGRVSFWVRNGLWVREDGRNTFPVAASFTEFVQSLKDSPG